jgi:hypothetical protein
MPTAPLSPDKLPSIDHNGTLVEIIQHYGYSTPNRGPLPSPRIMYGARDTKGERHWRSSLHEITSLIDHGFKVKAIASGV